MKLRPATSHASLCRAESAHFMVERVQSDCLNGAVGKKSPMSCAELFRILLSFAGPILAVVGGAIGWFATDHFTQRREWRNRAGVFTGYLLYFRHMIARRAPQDRTSIVSDYLREVCAYHRELGKIRHDFLNHTEFKKVSDQLGNLQPDEIMNHVGPDARDPITGRIDRLVTLIDDKIGS